MRALSSTPSFIVISLVTALLNGCNGPVLNVSPATYSTRLARTPSAPTAADRSRDERLIYVVYPASGFIAIYTWSGNLYTRKLLGPLSGPQGACSDRSGHIFITSSGSSTIAEFAHGGTRIIATLSDSGEYPAACSVDPISGSIAVTNYLSTDNGRGSVSIYRNGKSSPEVFVDRHIYAYGFCAYDSHGDLFVDGDRSLKNGFEFAELPHGAKTFKNVALGLRMKYPGPMQWDGRDISIEDPRTDVYYRESGGKIVDTVRLKLNEGYDFFIIAGQIATLAPRLGSSVVFWNYPAGGQPTRSFRLNEQPNDVPQYITVSK